MITFLNQGYAVYGFAALSVIGIFAALFLRRAYQKMIVQTEDMANAENKYIKQIKNRYENACIVNQGEVNTGIFLDKQIYLCRTVGCSLPFLGRLVARCAFLCLAVGVGLYLAGGNVGLTERAKMGYLYSGIIAAAAPMFVYLFFGVSGKKNQWKIYMREYLENSLRHRAKSEGLKFRSEEPAAAGGTRREERRTRREEGALGAEAGAVKNENFQEEMSQAQAEEERKRDIEYLKQSLERIAAGRERAVQKAEIKFTPEEEKLIEDILKEYFG